MQYVMFSKHTSPATGVSKPPTSLFSFNTPSYARSTAHAAAHELADTFENGMVSFVENSQSGNLWIVFDGPASYGSFFVTEGSIESYYAVFEPSFAEIQSMVASL